MHPAYSVIFFTVASGAGYGLLTVLALLAAAGLIAPEMWLGMVGFGLALALITGGLLSSTLHLGRPERAWRAFSQWRTSWLSREGVLAMASLVPAGLLALLFSFFHPGAATLLVVGVGAALGAGATVFATGMIYRTLKPIHAWCNRYVVPGYLLLGLSSGLLLAMAVVPGLAVLERPAIVLLSTATIIALLAALLLKRAYWHFIDTVPAASTPESATGLGALGKVRLLEAPHTQEAFLTKEMGFRVARKHARKLRAIAQIGGMLVPAALTLIGLALPGPAAVAVAILAALLGIAGAVVERWLFFAEAKHTVMLYYGAADA